MDSRAGSSGTVGGRNEGAIAPWLTDDVEMSRNGGSMSNSSNNNVGSAAMSTRAPARHPSYPTLGGGSSSGIGGGGPSMTSASRNVRQKSLNVPLSHLHMPGSTLTTIAASPPGFSGLSSGAYLQKHDDGAGTRSGETAGKGSKRPSEMRREGSYSSQNSTGGTDSNKLYRPSTASMQRGSSSSRDRQGSDDSSTLDGYGLDSTGSMVGSSTMTSSVSRLPPVSPSGTSSANGVYRDIRSGSQISLGSTAGQYHHQQYLHHQRETSGNQPGDKKKGLSALTGLLKRKGPTGGRPSTGGSDGSGPRGEQQISPGSMGPTSPSRSVRSGRPGSANDAVAPPFGASSGSMSERARRKTGHNPSVVSLAPSTSTQRLGNRARSHLYRRRLRSKSRSMSIQRGPCLCLIPIWTICAGSFDHISRL
jgi:hypothetical protein